MVANIVKLGFITILLLFFSACASSQKAVKEVIQTNATSIIESDYEKIRKQIIEFKTKLDKRNPKSYDKNLSDRIYSLLKSSNGDFLLKYNNIVLDNYRDYLQLAFSKNEVPIRNDYLVLGLYYLVNNAYEVNNDYKITALQFDVKKLQDLYKNLQLIKWKIKVDRDMNGDYLFLTWQNNWQIEMEQKYKDKPYTYEDIQNLEFIKNKRETIYSHSNFSFEVILTQMLDYTANSIRVLGEEPKELGLSALKMFIFI